jgi:hypothetical protein
MKHTIMMVCFLTTTLLTWLLIGTIYYMFSSNNIAFKEACTDSGVLFLTFILGWIPGVVVLSDLEKKL